MTPVFDLDIETNPSARTVDLRLADAHGNHLAFRQVCLDGHPQSRWDGLLNLRAYVQQYAGNVHPLGETLKPLDEDGLIRDLGVFLGREVLGGGTAEPAANLFSHLAQGFEPRTLRVRLPAATDQADDTADDLAALVARVPWEIARLEPYQDTLGEQNLSIRSLAGPKEPRPGPLEIPPKEPLRVLLVYSEAPGSRPLAARQERHKLLDLFHQRIYPRRRVEVDVLCHGVTRERLVRQINDRGGYHVVHWSGHGHQNLLELYCDGPEPAVLNGQELVDLFVRAGGYPPRLVFLSACLSGDFLKVRDWAQFQALLQGRDPDPDAAAGRGYTGTAHALLEAGIPTVVAMRYSVGDDYARDLAAAFYGHLLADDRPKRPEEALSQARRGLMEAARRDKALGYSACDHATPVLFGAADPGVAPPAGSTALPAIHPPLKIRELRAEGHPDFVGRTWELARLGSQWLEPGARRPVAVVRGLAGLGKTALAAEAIDLWHERFRWVFVFQAKPVPLNLDDFLRRLHRDWMEQQGEYFHRIHQYPAEAIWRAASEDFSGPHRHETLRHNLVRALQLEPVLLVLDNFESCLVPGGTGVSPVLGATDVSPVLGATGVSPVLAPEHGQDARATHACQDPEWDAVLAALASDLPGTNSRVLVTSRWALAVLSGSANAEDLLLGPLPSGEAVIYARCHPVLRPLFFTPGPEGHELVMRLLAASRGHPLLLDRLARLAQRAPADLDQALEHLRTKGLSRLADFFAADPGDQSEREYLDDALSGSTDGLLDRVGPAARRVLWVLSLANEPVTADLWRGVWEGKDFEPLVGVLVQIGLVTEAREGRPDAAAEYTCHELVRERIGAWIEAHPAESGGRTREDVWAAYGDRLISAFWGLVGSNRMAHASEAGSRALRYVVRAGQFDKLGQFASRLVTSTNDPSVLRTLLPDLEHAAASAPQGEPRWRARTYLADALLQIQPDDSLGHYAAAAAEAQEAERWSDLAWISGNWANALMACGQLDAARQKQLESARLLERAGRSAVDVLGSELEALRIDVMQGRAAGALPEIDSRLARIRAWWERTRRGESLPEAPDAEFLGRAFISALDIGWNAHFALEHWEPALERIGESIAAKRARGASEHEIARGRYNRCGPLLSLGRLDEAQRELEQCLEVFQTAGDTANRSKTLSALADLFNRKGDLQQAIGLERGALALCNTLPDPVDRGMSHHNLCNYLERAGLATHAAVHELAALVYWLVIGHGQHLQMWAQNHVIGLRRARASGGEHRLPGVAQLVARPDFDALNGWLADAGLDPAQLQAPIDAFLAQCRQAAEEP